MAKIQMAGRLAKLLGNNFAKAFPKATRGREIAGSLGYDALFGVMSGMSTPGDLTDKIIAGSTDFALGAGLSAGMRGTLGIKPGMLGNAVEIGGGLVGAHMAYPVSNELLRIKGGGKSPYDKLQEEQYKALRAEIEQDVLRQLMQGRRAPVVGDPFLEQNGLG